ncbi:hypothetical protein CKM354_000663100 [Cercospora kikuchii]|uniref:Uncharacterized protein n=1 Tax=Cercospora kikuchii TaxID=84275 RepID=A0A9P3CIK1_9PEZI|nr:uncharacterized protein CKM354_000663100 [Cercospora kikuchii]GIZ43403.1 hypothetical protein CKM354_000663100 [Cercospora kikuchii]
MLDCGEIEHNKVIMFLKATFYKGYATSSIVKHTMKQVEMLKPSLFPHNADKDLYDAKILVLAKHIEEVMEHVIYAQMRKFFEPIFQNNFDLIRRRLSPAVKALVVVGGLSDSEYFINRLREEFNAKDIKIECGGIRAIGRGCNPVTRGTLLKYAGKETRDLPITDSFGISEDQVYESDKHPDLDQLFGNHRDAPRNRPQRQQARSSQFYSDKYAKARWRTIVPEGPRTRQTLWQLRCVPVLEGEKDFLIQVFWSANQRPENFPIFTTNDGDQLRDGTEKFGAPLRITLPGLAQEQFEWKQLDRMPGKKLKEWFPGYCRICRTRQMPIALKKEHICWRCAKAEFYEVYYRLELTLSAANIYYRVEFAKPEKNDAIASGVQLSRDNVIRLGEKQLLISEHQNPNPRV